MKRTAAEVGSGENFEHLLPPSSCMCRYTINSLHSVNPLTSTLANSEDQDEMQHNAAFSESTLFVRVKRSSD